MSLNLSFEGGSNRHPEYGNIYVPEGWFAWWREGGYAAHDTEKKYPYSQPEISVIPLEPPFVDPERVCDGEQAVKFFTYFRIHWGGLYKRDVAVLKGSRVTFKYKAHAWSSTNHEADKSDTAGDGWKNFTFSAGIDPYGGDDPFADTVVWGVGAHVYNAYKQIPPVTVKAQTDFVTVFIRSTVKYPLEHCDAYFDDCEIEIEAAPTPAVCPKPREGWTERTTVLVHFDAPHEAWMEACDYADNPLLQHDVARSWDHAFWGPGLNVNIKCWQDIKDRFPVNVVANWGEEYYPFINANITNLIAYDPEPPPVWTPHRYITQGCLVGFHGCGDDGITDLQRLIMDRGGVMPSIKAYADYGWLDIIKNVDPNILTLCRLTKFDGINAEWFNPYPSDPNQTPENQAIYRMNLLKPWFEANRKRVDYFEIMNEQDPPGVEGQVLLARFFNKAIEIADAWQVKLAIFSHSTGVPEPGEWDAVAETGIFEKCAAGGHAFSLHEYGLMGVDEGSHLMRFRYVYDAHILPRMLNIPLFITEYGPHAWNYEGLSDGDLMAQLSAYDRAISQFPYVAGAHIFTLGGGGSWAQIRDRWSNLRQRYVDYVVSVKDRVNA